MCLCVRELREKTSFKSIVVRKSLLEVWQSIHLVHPKLRGSLVCGPSRVADPWFCCGYANAAMQKSDLERLLGRVDQLRSCVVKQLETPATNWNETSHSFHVVSEQIMAATDSLVSNVRDESSDQLHKQDICCVRAVASMLTRYAEHLDEIMDKFASDCADIMKLGGTLDRLFDKGD